MMAFLYLWSMVTKKCRIEEIWHLINIHGGRHENNANAWTKKFVDQYHEEIHVFIALMYFIQDNMCIFRQRTFAAQHLFHQNTSCAI